MTEKEFWDILNKIPGWYNDNGLIRRKARVCGRMQTVCPICAVANKKLRKAIYSIGFMTASTAINLPPSVADKIASAADYQQSYTRRKLLKLCK